MFRLTIGKGGGKEQKRWIPWCEGMENSNRKIRVNTHQKSTSDPKFPIGTAFSDPQGSPRLPHSFTIRYPLLTLDLINLRVFRDFTRSGKSSRATTSPPYNNRRGAPIRSPKTEPHRRQPAPSAANSHVLLRLTKIESDFGVDLKILPFSPGGLRDPRKRRQTHCSRTVVTDLS